MFPEYLDEAKKYYDGHFAYFCDTFIMKKELLNKYCDWAFKILFEVEKRLDYTNLSINATRMAAYFSEDLLSIFMFYNLNNKCITKRELQLVYFTNPGAQQPLRPIFNVEKTAIVISSSNEYVPYASVLINSILQNSNINSKYDIVILQTDILNDYKTLLESIIKCNKNF